VILTHRYRLLPQKSQHRALERLLRAQRELYNAALEERIDCHRKMGKTLSYIDQSKALTEWRREFPEWGALPVNLQRWTLKRLDEAFQAFFRRLKARHGKAGFPRFRGMGRWEAFGFTEFRGIRFVGLSYKVEKTGGHLIRVDPRNTTQECSRCHELVPKALAVRTHNCSSCGLVIGRDYNSSLNILRAGIGAGALNAIGLR
jgi:transposase